VILGEIRSILTDSNNEVNDYSLHDTDINDDRDQYDNVQDLWGRNTKLLGLRKFLRQFQSPTKHMGETVDTFEFLTKNLLK
jgi:hypothetical protein